MDPHLCNEPSDSIYEYKTNVIYLSFARHATSVQYGKYSCGNH
jgi:hypothetical protein